MNCREEESYKVMARIFTNMGANDARLFKKMVELDPDAALRSMISTFAHFLAGEDNNQGQEDIMVDCGMKRETAKSFLATREVLRGVLGSLTNRELPNDDEEVVN